MRKKIKKFAEKLTSIVKGMLYDMQRSLHIFFWEVKEKMRRTSRKAVKRAKRIGSLILIPFAVCFACGRAYERIYLINNENWRKVQ